MAVVASDGPSPQPPSLRLGLTAPQLSRCQLAQFLLGPSFHDPRTPQSSRIPPRANYASLPPWQWSTTCCRLPLRPCTAPLSCSLQPLLKLSLLNLTISAPICFNRAPSWFRLTLAESRKSDLWICVYVFTFSSSVLAHLIEMDFSIESLFAMWSLSPQRSHYYFYFGFLAVSEVLNHSDTCAVPSVCNTVGLLILLKLCHAITFLQQLMTKGLWVIYTYTCSSRYSIDVVASAPDDPCIY